MTIMVTATGSTEPGAFSAIATRRRVRARLGDVRVHRDADRHRLARRRGVAEVRLMLIHSTSAAPAAHSSKPGSVSLSTVAVKPPDEPPTL